MTKVLLTNCPAPKHGTSPFFNLEKYQPIGIAYLAASLKAEDIEVDFVDNYTEPMNMREYVEKTRPDFVGISVSSICWQEFLKMLDEIKDLGSKIIVGGPHVTMMPETIPPEVDYVVIGEGERAIVDIVKGKVNQRFVCYPQVKDLDELPDPDYAIFEGIAYWEKMEFLEGKTIALNTSRGCPMNCNFCGVSYIWGKTYRFLSADRVIELIKKLMEQYGYHSFYFKEDNFTLNRKRVLEFCKKAKPLGIEFVCESRIDNLDEKILKEMKESGCKGLYVGLESMTDRVLKLMNKGITVDMIKEKVALIKSFDIKIMGSFVINIPEETESEIEETIRGANELPIEIRNINVFAGMPRSKFYDDLLKSGEYEKIDENFIIRPKNYSKWARRIYGFAPV